MSGRTFTTLVCLMLVVLLRVDGYMKGRIRGEQAMRPMVAELERDKAILEGDWAAAMDVSNYKPAGR